MKKDFVDLIDRLFTQSKELGILQLIDTGEHADGKHITVKNKKVMYFGSCSYLGLETDMRLKTAAIEAVQKYGTQFSYSRGSLASSMYEELEDLLGQIFGKPSLVASTTTLGHISAIPILIGERDAMIVDHQVHNSVRNGVQLARANGVYMETIRHNRMDMLETRIQILRQNYDRIWYFCDGVYSMYGNSANFTALNDYLNRYDQFSVYMDDAHGMSWAGEKGKGLALSNMPFHPNMILTTSLAKSFASCGGVLVFNTEAQKNLIRNCGSSFIFSGPLQPAVLGASLASAKIHLSTGIETLQNELFEKMMFFIQKANDLRLPIVSSELTPIFYVAIGKQSIANKVAIRLLEKGFYCYNVIYPAVPVSNTGIRVALTRHHTFSDITSLLETMVEAMDYFMAEENYSYEEIYEAFHMPMPDTNEAKQAQMKIAS